MKKKRRNTGDIVWKSSRILVVIPEVKEREWDKRMFKNTKVQHFVKMINNIKLQIKEATWTLKIIFEKLKTKSVTREESTYRHKKKCRSQQNKMKQKGAEKIVNTKKVTSQKYNP